MTIQTPTKPYVLFQRADGYWVIQQMFQSTRGVKHWKQVAMYDADEHSEAKERLSELNAKVLTE